LTVLPNRLRVAQLRKSDLQTCALALIKTILFSNKERFLSYTDTSVEISIVLDEETVKEFPEDTLQFSPKLYRALELTSNSDSHSSLVHSMSDPLARAGISIFYISTYETDYTLIPEEDIHEAIDCLRKSFPQLIIDQQELPTPSHKTSHVNEDFARSRPISFTKKDDNPKKHKLTVCNDHLVLTSVQKHMLLTVGTYLIKFLFFPEKESRFFSYCETYDTISMILDSDDHEKLKEIAGQSLYSYDDLWQRISVDDGPLGFDESGIVASIVNPLARTGINVFYVSTFETDHLLVRMSDVNTAVSTLRSSAFVVNT